MQWGRWCKMIDILKNLMPSCFMVMAIIGLIRGSQKEQIIALLWAILTTLLFRGG